MTPTTQQMTFEEFLAYMDGTDSCYELVPVVDPTQLMVTICSLNEGAYDDQLFQGNQTIASSIFAELQLTAAQTLRIE